ncbi:hypothetical protein KC669_01225 [Candidatus Dojkabacteria bacterium]|uniref:Transglycosylase SLT domain-containing protein n=1 Tax=Candidatus Dojkabacteria bacterium TaxID=2099670 RepID=A0A955RL36_9BACT|nr:hypothetical protein [Candidatus Dojkabacteria bacterium]
MEQTDDPSPSKVTYMRDSKQKYIFLVFLFFLGISILVNIVDPGGRKDAVQQLRVNDYVEVAGETFDFIIQDIEDLKIEKTQQIRNQQFLLWQSTSPGAYEALIREQCAAVGCNAEQVIRVMYCESKGNALATNGRYLGLFQHDQYYWIIRAQRYGIPGASVFDPYSQIHVTTRMFSEGLEYLWQCK